MSGVEGSREREKKTWESREEVLGKGEEGRER